MNTASVGELVKRAKGEDRSLREYARDSGVDAAILSKMINGTYIPKKPGIYEALTSHQAAPRGGVTSQQLISAANTSREFQSGMSAGMSAGILASLDEIPSSVMIKVLKARGIRFTESGKEAPSSGLKPEEIRKIHLLQSNIQRFAATADGIILGSLGKQGLTFQITHTDGTDIDGIQFDTCVKLMNHDVSDYLIRYAFISEDVPSLAENTVRRKIEELVFLKPVRNRIVSVVTNHSGAYESVCAGRDSLSYNGELSVLLFDPDRAAILKQDYLAHYHSEDPVDSILLI
ncbi:MAG: hypothetical protein IKD66_10005 [Solobacterium sp.]|nr:hypothetical protein [Solobacterium sp.]